jgi:hypothetical protein
MALLILLKKNQCLIHIGISIQNIHIVTAGQNRDPSIGILSAQPMKQGCGTDQIADIIAPDD